MLPIGSHEDVRACRQLLKASLVCPTHGRASRSYGAGRQPSLPGNRSLDVPAACRSILPERVIDQSEQSGLKQLYSARLMSAGHALFKKFAAATTNAGRDADPWHRLPTALAEVTFAF